jgi:hypothetical protein
VRVLGESTSTTSSGGAVEPATGSVLAPHHGDVRRDLPDRRQPHVDRQEHLQLGRRRVLQQPEQLTVTRWCCSDGSALTSSAPSTSS